MVLGADSAPATEAGPPSFSVTGDGQQVWVAKGLDEPGHVDEIWWVYRNEIEQFVPPKLPLTFQPQVGKIVWAAARREWLHVFFDDGRHFRYGTRGISIDRNLPDTFLPLALAGDPAGQRLIALVPGWLAAKMTSSTSALFADDEPEAIPAATQPASAPRPASGPAEDFEGFWLVTFTGRDWQPWWPAPVALNAEPAKAALAVTGRDVHLFWSADQTPTDVQHAVLAEENWSHVVAVSQGWTGHWRQVVVADPLSTPRVVISLSQTAPKGDGFRLRLAVLRDGAWTVSEPIGSADGPRTFASTEADVALAAVGDQLALFERLPKGRVQYLSLNLNGQTTGPEAFIPAFDPKPTPAVPTHIAEPLSVFLLVFVLGIVMWRRQETIVEAIPLPTGTALASLGARALAASIDLFPALAITAPWWWPLVQEESFASGPVLRPGLWPMDVYLAWLAIRVIYSSYSFFFESLTGRTPGKRLTKTRVINLDRHRPTYKQCAVRNFVRLLEMDPLLQVFPALIVLIVTRNHQRLGDILAGTVVVAFAPPQARPAGTLREGDAPDDHAPDDPDDANSE
jgi:uncharacterized RDD family membrane protein YckC